MTLVGECVFIYKYNGSYGFMKIMEETATSYKGYDVEHNNIEIEKKDISSVLKKGECGYVKLTEL